MKLYVGNLPYGHADLELNKLFEDYGEVVSAKVIIDHHDGRSRGFGFVEMATQGEGQKAMEALNGSSVDGRELVVNEAREDKKRTNR